MQLMPATAKWTAKKIGVPYSPALIADRETNLKLGNAYLKLVLDDVGGSQPMAAAAYNAGPGRPRQWRNGPVLDAADLGRKHSLPGDARLRQEGAEQRHLLRGPAGRQGHGDPRPARPAGRARPTRTLRRPTRTCPDERVARSARIVVSPAARAGRANATSTCCANS